MNKVEITEENYEMYDKFCNIKYHIHGTKYPVLFVLLASLIATLCLFLGIVGAASYFLLINNLIGVFGIDLLSCSSMIYSLVYGGSMIPYVWAVYLLGTKGIPKAVQNIRMEKFQKQYPDFDINIDVKEVAKALKKYKELSKVPKNIEEKKCKHLTNLPDEVRKMSTQEKLAYLEQEKEFWEQVAVQEKYEKTEEKETQIQKRK